MADIDGMGSISPQDKALYKQEFERGANLFQKSFAEYQNSDGPQKDLFKDVMDKALQVMNETAKYCLSKRKQAQEMQLEKDYQNYIASGSSESSEKVKQDIDRLQKGLG